MMSLNLKRFGKAQVSAAVATGCDFLTSYVAYTLLRHVAIGTAMGAVTGGIVNCTINYLWTFRGTPRSKRSVVWRYILVWLGSVVLNTVGTEFAVKLCTLWTNTSVSLAMTAKAVVAIVVGVAWNYTMQRRFVYASPLPPSR